MPSITAAEMKKMTTEELNNAIATDHQSVNNYEVLQEIRNRYQDHQTDKMIEATEQIHCLTKKVCWLTIVITLATLANMLIIVFKT